MFFYRMQGYQSSNEIDERLSKWDGPVIIPLVCPESKIGKWLIGKGFDQLNAMSGDRILILYPERKNLPGFSFVEEVCRAFPEHDGVFRAEISHSSFAILMPEKESIIICSTSVMELKKDNEVLYFNRMIMHAIRIILSGNEHEMAMFSSSVRMEKAIYRLKEISIFSPSTSRIAKFIWNLIEKHAQWRISHYS